MIFPTIQFAAFFVVVFTLSWLLMPNQRVWKPFILCASYFFYGYADWRFVFLLGFSTCLNQVGAVWIYRTPRGRKRSLILAGAVVANLGLLGWFKYYDFFVRSFDRVFAPLGPHVLPLLAIALPVGISFFTFQAMSYIIDVSRDVIEPATFLDFAVYESFFPHIVAGPIVRAREFLPQLSSPRDPRRIPASRAFFLIIGGLIKKILIADLLATQIVDPVFLAPSTHSAQEIIFAVYGYAVQIYCDFSAYSDMAIGIAALLGFRFPDNFNRPYAAITLQDFWRRWHMTLSRWLRDFLYIPLGGNRGGRLQTYRNLMLTMLLGGLWHGASWTFVVWGGIHGTGLCVERYLAERKERRVRGRVPAPATRAGAPTRVGTEGTAATLEMDLRTVEAEQPLRARLATFLRGLLTFQVVCLAWIFFRAPNMHTAFVMLERMFTAWGPAPLVTTKVLLAIAVGMSVHFIPRVTWTRLQIAFSRLGIVWQGLALGLALVTINVLVGNQTVAPFIYFRF